MKLPLLMIVYRKLHKGWNRMSPEAQQQLKTFVMSQRCGDGYLNAGGKKDDYYTQFGKVLEAVISPWKVMQIPMRGLTVRESMGKDHVYGRFFKFILDELSFRRPSQIDVTLPERLTTNAVCCILAMQHQTGQEHDIRLIHWLQDRQDESGGFYSSEVSPVPDLLTTAVALFTLQLIGEQPRSATTFIDAHWLELGGFTPTILDEYSDVEYVFYGLLALGTNGKK